MLQYIELSLKNLSYRKARAILTTLGVIIGITAVVSMVSIGEGMTKAVREQFEAFGTNKILVTSTMEYGVRGKGLTDGDVSNIEDIVGVEFVSPMYSVAAGGEFKGEEKVITVWGLDPGKAERTFSDVGGYRLLKGRWLEPGDRNVVVLGYRVHDDFFKSKVELGNSIKIQGEKFRVVGIFKETGDPEHDEAVMVNIDKLRELMGREKSVTAIVVRVKPGYDVDEVRQKIEDSLERRHEGVEFDVFTSQQLINAISSSLKVIQVVFGGIAGVSLIVGGIGIANTMIMNVVERTQEIGIMKATGATNSQVMRIFLFESGVFGFFGGMIGVLIGYIISTIINELAENYLGPGVLTTAVTPSLAFYAISFAILAGVISGLYPAYKAVKLDPVEALRA
jgi:putative ABC transport system permease protein